MSMVEESSMQSSSLLIILTESLSKEFSQSISCMTTIETDPALAFCFIFYNMRRDIHSTAALLWFVVPSKPGLDFFFQTLVLSIK